MRTLIPLLAALCGCFHVPQRPLPNWKAQQLARTGTLPCSGFRVGQRLGDGAKVSQVHAGYVVIITREHRIVRLPCRAL